MSTASLNRKVHRIGALVVALPIVVIAVTGLLLLLKKDVGWIQPPSAAGTPGAPAVAFDAVLDAVVGVPEAEVASWDDLDRVDVRPDKGIVKVRCANGMEVQVDQVTGEVLQVARRRSDLIESIHDGSWFHDSVKLWVFLPTGLVLCILWGTGVYLWLLPHLVRRRRREKRR